MPVYKKRKNKVKYIVWSVLILLLILMIISFEPKPELTEIVLWS